jgi:hypothetical protein
VVRHELHAGIGAKWNVVDGHSAMAQIAAVTKNCLKAWSQRSTRLREWARNNLIVVDGELSAQQLAAAQKAHPAGQTGIQGQRHVRESV